MRYLSLFSGIEAATQAWHPLGWEAVAFAEIEPMPCSYLATRYPNVPNLGDVSKITNADIAALGKIDLVVGGSPCQGLSVAGKGLGLSDDRSGLFHQQMRIFHAARLFCGCRWLVWENVPGAFSTNHGRDFAVVVNEMAGCQVDVPDDGWGTEGLALGENGLVEWAVLDAQWFGVPQRRRRVFAVLDSGNWRDRPPVLLEPDRLRGDTAPFREPGEEVAGTLTASAGKRCGIQEQDGSSGLICANAEGSTGLPFLTRSNIGKCVNNQTPLIAKAYGLYGGNKRGDRPDGGFYVREEETSKTLDTGGGLNPSCSQGGVLIAFDATQITSPVNVSKPKQDDACHPLCATAHPPAIAYSIQAGALRENPSSGPNGVGVSSGVAYTLEARAEVQAVAFHANEGWRVRRLTPRECERLQGYPDDDTKVTHKGKPASDMARYRALGNGMAVPVMAWIGKQIDCALKFEKGVEIEQ